MKVVFLDFDGVLNSHEYNLEQTKGAGGFVWSGTGAEGIDPNAVALLDDLVESEDASIVISSTWRLMWPLCELRHILGQRGLTDPKRVIGKTTDLGGGKPRGLEVQGWLDMERERRVIIPTREPVSSFVILDDNDEFSGPLHDHYVETDPRVGLTPADVERARKILRLE